MTTTPLELIAPELPPVEPPPKTPPPVYAANHVFWLTATVGPLAATVVEEVDVVSVTVSAALGGAVTLPPAVKVTVTGTKENVPRDDEPQLPSVSVY
jgi:hypothetical protein